MQFVNQKKERVTSIPVKRTTNPIVTGSAVFVTKYKDGVMMCTDTLASYGSMAMFKQVQKMHILINNVIIAFDGEYSDFTHICEELDRILDDSRFADDNSLMTVTATFNYLRSWLYNARTDMKPLWNDIVVIGMQEGKPFVGIIDKLGAAYEEQCTSTAYGVYFCLPLMRDLYHVDMNEDEARSMLEECARVGYYRNCFASNRIQMAKVTNVGCVIGTSYILETKWPV